MSKVTLTTELMREWHVRGDHSGRKSRREYEAEFDRWLAGVKAEAWDEGHQAGTSTPNPYRKENQ